METRRTMLFAAILVVLSAAVPASAQFVYSMKLVPVVARLQGAAGTFWKSDLAIANTGSTTAHVGVAFFRENRSNPFPYTFPVNLTIAPGQTLTVEDVLGSWFPSEGDTKGMLLVQAMDEEADLTVWSRTYNAADPRGTYGQAVPSSLFPAVYGAGKAYSAGIRNDADYRTSIGILNLSPDATDARIQIYDAAGILVAETTRTVEGFSLGQWNVSQLGAPTLSRPGTAVVFVDPDSPDFDACDEGQFMESKAILAYVSTVDNRTGDAVFSMAEASWTEYRERCGVTPDEDCDPMNYGIAPLR